MWPGVYSVQRTSSMSVRAVVLLLSLAALCPGEAATRNEVQTALILASKNPVLQQSATRWLQLMNQPGAARTLNFNGQVTILLSSSYFFSKFKFKGLDDSFLFSMFNMHILQGRWLKKDLAKLPFGRVLLTKSGPKVRRGFHPRATIIRVNGQISGPRSKNEVYGFLFMPDFYKSPNVVVHGLGAALTPPEVKGGPFIGTPL